MYVTCISYISRMFYLSFFFEKIRVCNAKHRNLETSRKCYFKCLFTHNVLIMTFKSATHFTLNVGIELLHLPQDIP